MKRFLLVLAIALLLPACLLLAAVIFGATDFGQRWLAERLAALVNEQIAGQIELERAAIRFDGIELEQLAVRAPGEAEGFLTAKRIHVAPALGLSLLAGRGRIHDATFEAPRLAWIRPADGGPSNLERAFASATPAEEKREEADGGAHWEVRIDRLAIVDGALRIATEGEAPTLDLAGLSLETKGRVDPDGGAWRVQAAAALEAPLRGRIGLELEGAASDGFQRFSLARGEVGWGGSRLSFRGEADLDRLAAAVEELQGTLLPEDVPSLVAGWRPTAPLEVGGSARFASGALHADLEAKQGEGRLQVVADLRPASESWNLALQGTGIDPRGLDERAPEGAIDLDAKLEGASFAEAAGTIDLRRIRLGKGSAGPIHLTGRWAGERFELRALRLRIAGSDLAASGWTGLERADLRFEAQVPDAAALAREARRLGEAVGIEIAVPAGLSGDATLRGRFHGRFDAPSLEAALASQELALGEVRLSGLRADADLDGLPARPRGRVSARLDALRSPRGAAQGVIADLHLAGTHVRGVVDGTSPAGRIRADLDLEGSRDWKRIQVDRLDLRWPGAFWSLRRSLRLDLAAGTRIDGLSLASDHGGSIEANGFLAPSGGLALELQAQGIDLARIPPAFRPEGIGGVVSARATLRGTTARPEGEVSVGLRRGAAAGVDGVELDADFRLARANLDLVLRGRRGETALDVDGKLRWPLDRRTRGTIAARLRGLDLGEVAQLAGSEEPLAGVVSARIDLEGSLDAPQGSLSLRGQRLAFRELTGEVALDSTLGHDLQLRSSAVVGESRMEGSLTLTGGLRGGIDAILRAPMRSSLQVTGLDLARLAIVLPGAEGLRGKVDLGAELGGTLEKPRGAARLSLADGWNGDVGPLDADFGLEAEAEKTRLVIASRLLGRPFLAGAVGVGAPVERLLDPAVQRSAPLEGAITADGLEVPSVVWAIGLRQRTRGTVDGKLTLGGTTGAPVLALQGEVRDLSVGRVAWGAIAMEGSYARRRLEGSASFRPAGGGAASIRASWPIDLSVPALTEGSLATLGGAPLDVAFEANELDLTFLEGFAADFRQAAGKLDGRLEMKGRLPLPTFSGALALRDGHFGYTGFGDVRAVGLELELAPDALRLRRFHAEAGGAIDASGAAVRPSARDPYAIDLEIAARRFALTTDDVIRGYLDADARLTGSAGEEGIDARLSIARAEVDLADTPSKEIQSLAPHPDFVIVRGDGALLRERRKRNGARERSSTFPILFEIVSERPIEVEGTDVNLTATSDLRVLLKDGSPRLAGSVRVDQGQVLVLGRRFELDRGRIMWTGGEEPGDPRLDVAVHHESPYALVTVTVGGTLRRPTTNLRSNPPMTEAQIATLLATGRPQLEAGAGGYSEATGAASALGSVLASQLKNGIAAKLPLDVISFEAGEEGLAGSRLEAGTYITDKIYVGYARRFETSAFEEGEVNENEVRLEYRLAPRWSLEVTYGDAQVGGADLIWTRDF